MGQISRGQTVRKFEAYIARMKEGDIAPEPVETRDGYHIVYLKRGIAGKPLPFELVEHRIRDDLSESVMRRAVSQHVRILVERASIQRIDMAGSDTQLVHQ